VIGAAIIVVGLYFLIWGKSKDDVSQASGGSKGAGDLPLTSATNGHGSGKHELSNGNANGGHVFDVETPPANGHY
jgi:hypothetical protein